MKTILVPLDGSPTAAAALPHALGFSARFGARLRLLNARDETPPERLELRPAEAGWQSWEYLQAVGKRLHAHTEMLTGAPAEAIVREAASLKAGLILMGTNSRHSRVADFVLRHASCPVLLVHAPSLNAEESDRRLDQAVAGQYPRYPRILVPLDGTPACERSLGPAFQLSVQDQSQVTLVRVLDTPGEMEDAHRAYLEERASQLRALGCPVDTRYCHGPFGARLAELPHDLIVLTARSQPTLGGSKLEQVVQRAHCPVLVLRGTESWLLDPASSAATQPRSGPAPGSPGS